LPLFSVIIPSYNRGDLIAETIDSVLAQDCTDHEIVVADDGSTDSTMSVLARYGDRIRVHRQANAGPGAARNLALRHATGTYVAFLDSDDLWLPWTLSTYAAVIEAEDSPSIIVGPWREFTGKAPDPPPRGPLTSTRYGSFFRSPLEWHLPSGTAMRREMLTAAGGFSTAACEDVDIWMRVGGTPGFVALSSPVCFLYRSHPAGISQTSHYRFNGIRQLLQTERGGGYGGAADRDARRRYIAQATRAASMFYLERRCPREALSLYWHALGWQLRQGRLRYALIFPLLVAWRTVTSRTTT
jgi:glycosyltransferase involved in cell wall biosynthesis